MSNQLFEPTSLGNIKLQNAIVMAPLTRSRAINNIPNELMAEYYSQRASAGLIITEGTSPSPNGLGYARIPGTFNADQVAGWKLVTDAVHAKGGKIFLQIMHTGRVSHPLNMADGTRILAPSAVQLDGEMWTDVQGNQPYPVPQAMSIDDIEETIQEYVDAAKNAIEAGFDGVELHGANGYLIDQFFHPNTNQRTDEYGGSYENRIRFALEVAEAVVEAIGKERVGIRLSPYGVFKSIAIYDELDATYGLLAEKLSDLGLTYIHLVDHSPMGAPEVPANIKATIRKNFKQNLILSGGYDAERAAADLQAGKADLIAFGRPFISNPDLVERYKSGAALNQLNPDLFYTPGPEGYTDYPALTGSEA
ncbi:MAG: alkene reductase [Bacteroidota bacterium]